jgi:hypothetical protein
MPAHVFPVGASRARNTSCGGEWPAATIVRLDVPMPLRTLIAGKLEKSGVLPLQTAKIREFISVGRSDLASMYDESLPPGLLLGTDHENADG